MAEVFLATSMGIEGFQRHVVIKRIHGAQATNAQFVQIGQLANNTTAESHVPIQVTGLASVAQIVAGEGHTCARKTDRGLLGANGDGQVGVMQLLRAVILASLLLAAFACKGGGGAAGVEYKHESPRFKVSIPSDLKPRSIKPEGDGGTRAFMNADVSRDILLVWAKSGSTYDPENQWSRYGKEPDHVRTIAEGQLPGGVGKWIEHDRGRIYVHAVMAKDGWGVLCMTSTPTDKPASDIVAACKTLTSY